MKRALLTIVMTGCATLATAHDETAVLPSAGIGPFRKLTGTELKGVAPFVLDDFVAQYQDPDAISDPDGSISLFAAATDGDEGVIVRTRATDGRSFYGGGGDYLHTPLTVLRPSLPWEGTRLFAPSVVRRDGVRWLYYACDGGIGVAVESGTSWKKTEMPVLSSSGASGWEHGVPTSPDAIVMPDGTTHLFFSSGRAIGEAVSADGVSFIRLQGDPALVSWGEGFASLGVGDPEVVVRVTAADRIVTSMLFTATDSNGITSIGVASRFGENGAFERRESPVYAIGKGERAPTLVPFGELTFLYLTQPQSGSKAYPAVAAAVSPADKILSTPDPFPETL